ncbi:MAG: YlmC/YmxH family sporulation protein [Lachnospiraceae bacterium]|nr:YlmC/YmxH family sporulation protein [Lachnospiraceae bacterium]
MLFSELTDKEVISIKDCRCLGKIGDLEFNCQTGCIEKVYIPAKGKLCNFFQPAPEYTICYRDIRQIGPDVILVDV